MPKHDPPIPFDASDDPLKALDALGKGGARLAEQVQTPLIRWAVQATELHETEAQYLAMLLQKARVMGQQADILRGKVERRTGTDLGAALRRASARLILEDE